jgi:hypothetical protein
MFAKRSVNRLTDHDLGRFPGDSLFDRIGRAVCAAGCLPRKELYEAWEMARRVRRRFRGGRVVDLAGGHGLLGQLLLLLDASSPAALVVDEVVPASAAMVHEALTGTWPRLHGRVTFLQSDLDGTTLDRGDLVVSCHACGGLTDRVLARAAAAGARVAVLPCCHDVRAASGAALGGWLDPALAIDVARAQWLESRGYTVWTQTIPADITPKNRLLLGAVASHAIARPERLHSAPANRPIPGRDIDPPAPQR